MFRIGDFSRLSQVPVTALRFYDDMGLFKPAQVDRFTGYRYYTLEQLPRLNRILALRDLGLSLEQIAELLDEAVPAEQIRGMLRLKQAELQQHIAALTGSLALPEDAIQASDGVEEPEEEAVDLQETDVEQAILDNEKMLLAEVQQALARIENGTYGICSNCGQPISIRKTLQMGYPTPGAVTPL